jgi:hypothetical protein
VHHIDRLARPGIVPFAQDLAGFGVEIEHDLAADHTIALAALGVGHRHALPDVHAFALEQQAVGFALHPAVDIACPMIDRRLAIGFTALDALGDFKRIFGLGRI